MKLTIWLWFMSRPFPINACMSSSRLGQVDDAGTVSAALPVPRP